MIWTTEKVVVVVLQGMGCAAVVWFTGLAFQVATSAFRRLILGGAKEDENE